MLSWVDELIREYTENRRGLSKMKNKLNPDNPKDAEDLKLINSMIASMIDAIQWMETGKDPNVYRGVHKHSIYQKWSYENMDLIPDIAEELKMESINNRQLFMSSEEKIIMADILSSFSYRERTCYLLHVGHQKSFGEIARELVEVRCKLILHGLKTK